MDPNQYNNNSYNGGYGGQGFNQPTYGQQDFIQQGGSNQDFYNPVQNTGSTYYGGNQHQATYGAPQPTQQYGGYNPYNQYSQTQYAPPPLPTYDQSQATNQGYGQQTQGYGGQGYNNYNQPQGGYSAAPANTTTEHFTYAGASDWKDSNDHKYSKNAPAVSADYLEGILQACINEVSLRSTRRHCMCTRQPVS